MKLRPSSLLPTLLLPAAFLLALSWCHSYASLDRIYLPLPGNRLLFFTSAYGVLHAEYRNSRDAYDGQLYQTKRWSAMTDPLAPPGPDVRKAFQSTSATFRLPHFWQYAYRSSYVCTLSSPYWQVLLLLLAWPIGHLIRRFTRPQRSPTLCPTCRYDLRAHLPTPNSEFRTLNSQLPPRCPECGTPITRTKTLSPAISPR